MNINPAKFDTELGSHLEPFMFVEKTTEIDTTHATKVAIISFGAMDVNNHYAPEFGGVALVHIEPDLFIAVKYIPWDAEARAVEHNRCVDFINSDEKINPKKLIGTLKDEFGFILPSLQEKERREYLQNFVKEHCGIEPAEKKSVPGLQVIATKKIIEKPAGGDDVKEPDEKTPDNPDDDWFLDGEKLI